MFELTIDEQVAAANAVRGPEKLTVEAVDVVRWFNIDARAFWNDGPGQFTDIHEKMFDVLMQETNAKEVQSGHCGFNVALVNDQRTDDEIIKSLLARIEESGLMNQQEAPDDAR